MWPHFSTAVHFESESRACENGATLQVYLKSKTRETSMMFSSNLIRFGLLDSEKDFVLKVELTDSSVDSTHFAAFTVHLRLIGKLVVDFLFVLNELFALGLTPEALRANIK